LVDSLELDELAVAELEVAALHGGNTWDTSAAFTGGGQRRCDAGWIGDEMRLEHGPVLDA